MYGGVIGFATLGPGFTGTLSFLSKSVFKTMGNLKEHF